MTKQICTTILVVFLLLSCSNSKLVYKTKASGSKIKYYVTDNPKYREGEGKFYARVDSGDVRIFYSFQIDNIYKTYNNVSGYVYTLVFDKKPVPVLQLTSLDSIVLNNADRLLDSLNYTNLKRPKGAAGFVVEVSWH